MKNLMLKNYTLILMLLIIIIVGNVWTETYNSQPLLTTMKQVICSFARKKAYLPPLYGTACDLVEALAKDPGIYRTVAFEINVTINEGNHNQERILLSDMLSGKELYSTCKTMADYGILDQREITMMTDLMKYTPIDKFEFIQLPEEIRKKIKVIFEIACSSNPERLVSALIKNSNFTLSFFENNSLNPQELANPEYKNKTVKKESEERQAQIQNLGLTQEFSRQSWARFYGGYSHNQVYSMQQTTDGGFIVAGHAAFLAGSSSWDVWIIKLGTTGDVEWQRIYGGEYKDVAYSIQQTADGGYIVAGFISIVFGGETDVWVLKLNSIGDIEWRRAYGGSNSDMAKSVQQTDDGGYIVAGQTSSFGSGESDGLILKLSSNGDVEWQKTYGGSDVESVESIKQTNDGGYVAAGSTNSSGAGWSDILILKLDSNGDIEWQQTYGETSGDGAYSIQQTSDGGYIVAGFTYSFGAGERDFWVLKLSSNGNVEWQRSYGGANNDTAHSIQQTADGGYVAAGYTYSFGAGRDDFWVLKLDRVGNVEWEHTYGGSSWDRAFSIQQISGGGYLVSGYTWSYGDGLSDFFVIKIDPTGYVEKLSGFTRNSSAAVSDTYITPLPAFITTQDADIMLYGTNITVRNTNEIGNLLFSPPLNSSGSKVLNRSLSQAEYLNMMTWEGNPENEDLNIEKYRVYLTQVDWYGILLLAEKDADDLVFWHREVWKEEEYVYAIVGVYDENQESIPALITIR
ncbi:MAG: hypothetical protein KAU46_06505 [Candidatus Aminicenantes bacterium]|nr:hypothetical protein [Candidatus Aminicenantes bacterium]